MNLIKKENLIKNNGITIEESNIPLNKYDMYYISFKQKNGSTRTVRAFTNKGCLPKFSSSEYDYIQRHYSSEFNNFLVERLVGENSLLSKQRRDDYIYFGENFLKYGRNPSLGIDQIQLQDFNKNLFSLKLNIEAFENPQNSYRPSSPSTPQHATREKGKNYAIGDIHGMYGSYLDAMKRLGPQDHIYVLGDVLDRGSNGLKILQDIIDRQKNPQNNSKITFLLGNHELQFMEVFSTVLRRGLTSNDLNTILQKRIAEKNMTDAMANMSNPNFSQELNKLKSIYASYQRKVQDLQVRTGLSDYERQLAEIYMFNNKGNKTIFEFMNNISSEKKDEIYNFLLDSYVVLPQNINGKDYLFVHSMPPNDNEMLRNMKQNRRALKVRDSLQSPYLYSQCHFMLEERDFSTYEKAKQYGFTTICGHTPSTGTIIKDSQRGYIRIDAGCGHISSNNKLALYCIDDGNVQYFNQKENAYEPYQL